jgi:hypothetical protein
MTIDVRAKCWVSFDGGGGGQFPLISAAVSDSEIQTGVGIITTTGTCVIDGIATPTPGGQINILFQMAAGGGVRRIPRTLRVFSSFADPLRGTTQVEFGCPFAYSRDVADRSTFAPKEPTERGTVDAGGNAVTRDPTLRVMAVRAADVLTVCLAGMGIIGVRTPSLQSEFFVDEFDLSAGYFQVASDLLVSEGHIVSASSVFSSGGSAALDASSLIDISPLGIGGIPGAAVNVTYNAIVLTPADNEELLCESDFDDDEELYNSLSDSEEVFSSNSSTVSIAYTDSQGQSAIREYTTFESTQQVDRYKYIYIEPSRERAEVLDSFDDDRYSRETRKKQRVLSVRDYYEVSSSVSVAGSLATAMLSAGFEFGNFSVESHTQEIFTYDGAGNEVSYTLDKTGSGLFLLGTLSVPMVFDTPDGPRAITPPLDTYALERVNRTTRRYGNTLKTVTERYLPWSSTIPGQQSIAEGRDSFSEISEAEAYIAALGGLYLSDVTTNISEAPPPGPEVVSDKDLLLDNFAENESGIYNPERDTLGTLGDGVGAIRAVTFNLPYAPDDIILPFVQSSPPTRYCYRVRKANPTAAVVARKYGVAQNNILIGYRNGINIVTSPEFFMPSPGMTFAVRGKGFAGQYLVNGTTWTISQDGIVVSVDGLAMGTLGKV